MKEEQFLGLKLNPLQLGEKFAQSFGRKDQKKGASVFEETGNRGQQFVEVAGDLVTGKAFLRALVQAAGGRRVVWRITDDELKTVLEFVSFRRFTVVIGNDANAVGQMVAFDVGGRQVGQIGLNFEAGKVEPGQGPGQKQRQNPDAGAQVEGFPGGGADPFLKPTAHETKKMKRILVVAVTLFRLFDKQVDAGRAFQGGLLDRQGSRFLIRGG